MCRHSLGRALFLAWAVVAAAACDRRETPTPGAAAESVRSESAKSVETPNWVGEFGQALIVPLDSENTGVVLFPTAPSARLITSAPLLVLGSAGDTATTRAALVVSDSQVCGEASTVRLTNPPARSWTIALLGGAVTPIQMDSIEGLPPADSARVVTELARLASALPMSRENRFARLPFVVLSARLFEIEGRRVVSAHLLRRLPQEASPFEEHTLLIAERGAGDLNERFAIAYHERSEGTEETADHFELLSAVRARGRTFLVVTRDQDARTTYEILERGRSGWRSRWVRTLAC